MSIEEAKAKSNIEWQTRAIAAFLSGLAQTEKGGKQMSKAVEELSIFPERRSKKKAPPTKDHLAPEDGSAPPQPSPTESMNGGPQAGSFEKLGAIFGTPGPRFQLPAGSA